MQITFEEAYNHYLKYIDSRLKEQSKRSTKDRIKNHILPYFKDFYLNDIKEIDYLNWQLSIEQKNYSYKYLKTLHTSMVMFLNYCMKYFSLERNIASIVGTFKDKGYIKKEFYCYNHKEFKRFIKYCDNNIYKQFFNFMFYVGTRPGETMALRFSDLKKSTISINKTISERNINGSRYVGSPKTTSSIRYVEIDKKLNRDLLKLKKYYIKIYDNKYFDYYGNWEKIVLKSFKDKNIFLRLLNYFIPSFFLKIYLYFVNKKTYKQLNFDYYIFGGIKPLAPTTINRYKDKVCQLANLKNIRLHDFRHSHATLLIKKKMYIKEVSRRLGHSNPSTTLNIYTHTDKEQEKKVIKTLNFLRLF